MRESLVLCCVAAVAVGCAVRGDGLVPAVTAPVPGNEDGGGGTTAGAGGNSAAGGTGGATAGTGGPTAGTGGNTAGSGGNAGTGGTGGTGGSPNTGGTGGSSNTGGTGGSPNTGGTGGSGAPDAGPADTGEEIDAAPPKDDAGTLPSPDDAAPPADTASGDTGVIACGALRCDAATEICCAGAGGTTSCVRRTDLGCGLTSSARRCDGPEDCDPQAVCCAEAAAFGGYRSTCMKRGDCEKVGAPICRGFADCNDGPYKVCAVSDYDGVAVNTCQR